MLLTWTLPYDQREWIAGLRWKNVQHLRLLLPIWPTLQVIPVLKNFYLEWERNYNAGPVYDWMVTVPWLPVTRRTTPTCLICLLGKCVAKFNYSVVSCYWYLLCFLFFALVACSGDLCCYYFRWSKDHEKLQALQPPDAIGVLELAPICFQFHWSYSRGSSFLLPLCSPRCVLRLSQHYAGSKEINSVYFIHILTTCSFYSGGFHTVACGPPEPLYGNGAVGFWVQAFVLSKLFELIDTLFIVLRKRDLMFLHW